jgi:hypothetical protein
MHQWKTPSRNCSAAKLQALRLRNPRSSCIQSQGTLCLIAESLCLHDNFGC